MLLMMGGEVPETCWATHKRQVINLCNCYILLVNLFESDFPCLFSNTALKCNYVSYRVTCRHQLICQYCTPRGCFITYRALPLCITVYHFCLEPCPVQPMIVTIMMSTYQWNPPSYAAYILLHGLTVSLV